MQIRKKALLRKWKRKEVKQKAARKNRPVSARG